MADALAVSLHASGAESTSGVGASVDIGELRTAVVLRAAVSQLGASTTLDVSVETSSDGSNWLPVGAFPQFTAVGTARQAFGPCMRYVRARWTVAGANSATFAVVGEAHVIYAELDDMTSTGVRSQALEDVATSARIHALLRATADIDAALSSRYKLPLASWPEDVRGHCASRAVYYSFKHRGYDPDSVTDQIIVMDGGLMLENGQPTAVQAWLLAVAKGKINPVGIVDSTPSKSELGARVAQ